MGGKDKGKVTENPQDVKKKEKKKKSKDAAVEALKEALKALPQDQQVTTLLTKYAEVIEENKNLQTSSRTFERNAQQALKDKEKIELEHSKTVLTRSRLESLCRELQRQNKVIKDENIVRLKEEEDRRKEVSSQFNSTLSEISHLMDENTQNNSKLREENKKMASRLQDLVRQHEQREDHVEKILKQREIETQLSEAKLAKLQIEVKEQKEKMLIDRKGLLEELSILQDKLREKALTEISLRTQLNSYTEKFEEFQGTLDKSNQVFNGFKKEIEQMSKTIKTLEKETKTWKEKFENANVALCQMFNERTKMEANLESQKKQNLQLQSLCRALQKQTRELRSQLKAQGIEEKSTDSLEEVSKVSTTLEEESNTIDNSEKTNNSVTRVDTNSQTFQKSKSSKNTYNNYSNNSNNCSKDTEEEINNDGTSSDCESNKTAESELDMEAVD